MNRLIGTTIVASSAQIAMVAAGHVIPAIADLFAIGGMGISALAGWAAVKGQTFSLAAANGSGALVGAACALIGIAVSVALGDVPASMLAVGTAGSAVTGLIGGLVSGLFGRRR